MAERLSDNQIRDLSSQVQKEASRWQEKVGPRMGYYIHHRDEIPHEVSEAALDAMMMAAFRQGLDVTIGKMLPILHLPSGRVVQFQIKEESK